MTTRFSTLPTELIEFVASESQKHGIANLYNLRLVCRSLNEKTFRTFSRQFRTLHTDFSPDNLQRLKEISKHEQISRYVHNFKFDPPKDTFVDGSFWHRHPFGCLLPPLPALEILREPLNQFINCRSYFVDNQYDATLPCDSSIGFAIIARISLPVEEFTMDLTRGYTFKFISQSHVLPHTRPKLGDDWVHLKRLDLGHVIPEDLEWISKLILHASALQKLSLRVSNSHHDASSPFSDGFSTFINRLRSAETLPWLHELQLDGISISEELTSQ